MNREYLDMKRDADNGDVIAQVKLATAYVGGEVDGEPNLSKGLEYMQMAAESNNDAVQHMYAVMLEKIGLTQQSMEWHKRAAHNGNLDSQAKLAKEYYITGYMGVDKENNYTQALYWAEKAFAKGELKESPLIIAVLQFEKEDVTTDDAIYAYKLIKIAEAAGNESATVIKEKVEKTVPQIKEITAEVKPTEKVISKYKVYKGIGFGNDLIGEYADGKIYQGIGACKEQVGEYGEGKIYNGIGFGKEWIGEYEDGKIYSGIGWGKEWIGEYGEGKIYKGIGWSKECVGEYEGDCGGAAAALLLIFLNL